MCVFTITRLMSSMFVYIVSAAWYSPARSHSSAIFGLSKWLNMLADRMASATCVLPLDRLISSTRVCSSPSSGRSPLFCSTSSRKPVHSCTRPIV